MVMPLLKSALILWLSAWNCVYDTDNISNKASKKECMYCDEVYINNSYEGL
jgi:hypothetical protein